MGIRYEYEVGGGDMIQITQHADNPAYMKRAWAAFEAAWPEIDRQIAEAKKAMADGLN